MPCDERHAQEGEAEDGVIVPARPGQPAAQTTQRKEPNAGQQRPQHPVGGPGSDQGDPAEPARLCQGQEDVEVHQWDLHQEQLGPPGPEAGGPVYIQRDSSEEEGRSTSA